MKDLFLLWALLILLFPTGCVFHDDTDGKAGQHSGLALYTDSGTGCEYVATITGSITPRMNKDKTQVCR